MDAHSNELIIDTTVSLTHLMQQLAQNPTNADAVAQVALFFLAEQKYTEAAAYFECAAALVPSPLFDLGRGKSWLEVGDHTKARQYFTHVLRDHPQSLEALVGMGNSLFRTRNWAEALTYFSALEPLLPEHAELRRTMARCYNKQLMLDQAEHYFQACLALDPNIMGAYIELAWLHYEKGKTTQALNVFDAALKRFGSLPDIIYSRSLIYLQIGEWTRAFEGYEQRWHTTDPGDQYRKTTAPLSSPHWDGVSSLEGKTVMAMIEQGAGDILQFARYCWHLKQCGAAVDILAPDFMASIMQTVPWVRSVHSEYELIPPHDFHVSLMSCPYYFGTTQKTIPDLTPYLHAPYKRARFSEKPTIGLVWAGSQAFLHDHHRSGDFHMYEEMINRHPECTFVSLQMGPRASEAASFIADGKVIDGTLNITNYADTAAALESVDLLISTCTSIVHLAGAMQRPTYVLLSAKADWRWLEKGSRTAWYPQTTLYRQQELGDWRPVLAKVEKDLAVAMRERLNT
ncbi:MAG: tetratricopeptide repeat protein [Rickettsiales bacterium]|nr:tetratricopeptide repeat protein [Rickettsiales bacterium]